MCGITGFAERNHKAETARRIVKGMADLITYRGPDGEGYYVDDQVALGHRRLSIIDLEGGKQPMFNEDGSLVCIFNGEIYNFQTLREELIAAGHTFATRSDTEVLLHGYEQWGNQLPGKLRGMFTFVIWDQKTKTMFGARDIFGIKPFYYYNQDGLFLFGSEIKSFLAHPGFKKELNEERLPEYLSIEYIPNEETMFKNVYKLPSGCMFTWENGELTVERYYEIKYHVDDSKSLEEWEKIITDTFAESVAAHQIADVEVGCFLSSGVDSSFVVNEVAKGTPHVKSFSVGYAEEKYSELPAPRRAILVDSLPERYFCGMDSATSSMLRSRKGTRSSRLLAMLMRSAFSRISYSIQVCISTHCSWVGSSRPCTLSK